MIRFHGFDELLNICTLFTINIFRNEKFLEQRQKINMFQVYWMGYRFLEVFLTLRKNVLQCNEQFSELFD